MSASEVFFKVCATQIFSLLLLLLLLLTVSSVTWLRSWWPYGGWKCVRLLWEKCETVLYLLFRQQKTYAFYRNM